MADDGMQVVLKKKTCVNCLDTNHQTKLLVK